MSNNIKPKEFISCVLAQQMKVVVECHPYFSFVVIAVGIEFLGKCMLTKYQDWNNINPSKAFDAGIKLLVEVDKRYGEISLKENLRNGLVHSLLPKFGIALSERKHKVNNFQKSKRGETVIVVEDFYDDFVRACKIVLEKEFPQNDKMNKIFLYVGE